MESGHITERLVAVRTAILAASDGQAARELSERIDDLTDVPVRA
jgi:hypothetical protein